MSAVKHRPGQTCDECEGFCLQPVAVKPALPRRILEWEVVHLRALVAAQQEQIEYLHGELRLAESWGEMWHRAAENEPLGLTQSGDLVRLAS